VYADIYCLPVVHNVQVELKPSRLTCYGSPREERAQAGINTSVNTLWCRHENIGTFQIGTEC
jgi:hypothetical protein